MEINTAKRRLFDADPAALCGRESGLVTVVQTGHTTGMGAGSRKRVLVVEDDPEIRELLHKALGKLYEVTLAEDGQEGLEKARADPHPDLIVSDIMMPRLDGLRMVGLLRSEEGLGDIPVIFLTARDQLKDITAGITVGASYYMTKPFIVSELLERVEATLERTSSVPGPKPT